MKHTPILFLALLGFFALTGCGGGGGGGGSSITVPAMNTTVSGQLTVPSVAATDLLAAVTYTNDDDLIQTIASSAVCTVNGKTVAYSLTPATRYFSIPDLEPSTYYDVKFTLRSIQFRMIVPHSSYNIFESMNLDTTAEAMLVEKYQLQSKLSDFSINQEWKDYLANQMLTRMQDPTTTRDAFQSFFEGELASFSTNVPLTTLTTNLTPAVDLTGTWKGTNCVFYNLNLYGERAYVVTANVTMVLKQSGNSVTGTLDIYPQSQERLPGIDLGVPEPEHHSTVNGTISSTKFTFSVNKELWEFDTLSRSMRGKVSNTDQTYYLGIESDEKAFLLTME